MSDVSLRAATVLQSMMNECPQAVWAKDCQFRYQYANAECERYFLVAPDRLLQASDFDLLSPEAADEMRLLDQLVLRTGQPVKTVRTVQQQDQSARRWLVHIFPVTRLDDAQWVGGTASDITDLPEDDGKTGEAPSRSERTYQLLVESSPLCIHQIDQQGRFQSINRAGLDMINEADAQNIIGVPYLDAVSAADRDRVEAFMHQAFLGKEIHFDFVGAFGQRFRSCFVPLQNDDGRVDALLGITEDISTAWRDSEQLRKSEERYRLVARATRDPIWEIDVAGGTAKWNEAYEQLFGGRPEESAGSWDWWTERINADERDRVVASLQQALNDPSAENWSEDYHLRGADGTERLVQDRAWISRDAAGKPLRIIGSMRDQTPIEQAMIERQNLMQKVQEAQKLESLGVLAGGIAHDFNNILCAILGNVSLVRMETAANSPHQEFLQNFEEGALRAADLCRQLLAYAGKGRFEVRNVDLCETIHELMPLLTLSISKNTNLQLQLSTGLPPVKVDVTQINQLIMNLVINASEAIGDANGIVSLTTGIQRVSDVASAVGNSADDPKPGNYVYLEVSDTGAGMDPATASRIFEPFFSTKFAGRGLGLAAVQGIVRGHKGLLTVESTPELGTTFRVLLPRADGRATAPQSELSPGEGTENLSRRSILVVDDQEPMRRMTQQILEQKGFCVRTAIDGQDGLEHFRSQCDEIDLVILDLTMPRMNGVDALRAMKEIRPDVPVLLMSGYDEQRSLEQFTGLSHSGFLSKPFRAESLLAAVDSIMSQGQSTRGHSTQGHSTQGRW